MNATSNVVAEAPAMLGFDRSLNLADYITRRSVRWH
jgi:hypothetical protein